MRYVLTVVRKNFAQDWGEKTNSNNIFIRNSNLKNVYNSLPSFRNMPILCIANTITSNDCNKNIVYKMVAF